MGGLGLGILGVLRKFSRQDVRGIKRSNVARGIDNRSFLVDLLKFVGVGFTLNLFLLHTIFKALEFRLLSRGLPKYMTEPSDCPDTRQDKAKTKSKRHN